MSKMEESDGNKGGEVVRSQTERKYTDGRKQALYLRVSRRNTNQSRHEPVEKGQGTDNKTHHCSTDPCQQWGGSVTSGLAEKTDFIHQSERLYTAQHYCVVSHPR